ncbi:hypothetical protein ppKF707_6023 [Metapseudomonas furukawaii]|uniref:Uncharacterized protein n=1 Tax=Metapseudomonas furukawaii TaxID=1149133 RepID=L8MIH8_METFU|nr:hypothetical protein ppKF707_5883 [Pseudomonas furukawaii]ELS28323.1 hypothetical protein ppKF707_6023 [Pseudomonas furukawaii]BAU76308.1 hypothetical protein KF707C_46200 [Pseudomonas furukawaii]
MWPLIAPSPNYSEGRVFSTLTTRPWALLIHPRDTHEKATRIDAIK